MNQFLPAGTPFVDSATPASSPRGYIVAVTLTGQNFASTDKQTGERKVTGAYVPYGTPTTCGQVIPGRLPCNGAIMRTP